jgi:hypothetical protein
LVKKTFQCIPSCCAEISQTQVPVIISKAIIDNPMATKDTICDAAQVNQREFII